MTEHGTPDEEALRAEIDQTRAELGETVEELAARTHVSARARHAAGRTARRVRDVGENAVDGVRHTLGSAAAAVRRWGTSRRRSR